MTVSQDGFRGSLDLIISSPCVSILIKSLCFFPCYLSLLFVCGAEWPNLVYLSLGNPGFYPKTLGTTEFRMHGSGYPAPKLAYIFIFCFLIIFKAKMKDWPRLTQVHCAWKLLNAQERIGKTTPRVVWWSERGEVRHADAAGGLHLDQVQHWAN